MGLGSTKEPHVLRLEERVMRLRMEKADRGTGETLWSQPRGASARTLHPDKDNSIPLFQKVVNTQGPVNKMSVVA